MCNIILTFTIYPTEKAIYFLILFGNLSVFSYKKKHDKKNRREHFNPAFLNLCWGVILYIFVMEMSHNVKLIYNNDDDMEGYLGKCGGKK